MTTKKTAIEQMVSILKTQVDEVRKSMKEAKQYGVNSAGFNAYMGQMEMAKSMLEQAQLLVEGSKPQSLQDETNKDIHHPADNKGLWESVREWWNVRPLRTSKGETIPGSPYKNVDEWSIAFSEILVKFKEK